MPALPKWIVVAFVLAAATVGYVFLRPGGSEDHLPLADVPNSELERAGISIDPVSELETPVSRDVARALANDIACCGDIQQTVLVRLGRRDNPSASIVAWAVNYDTSTGPASPPHGGYWRAGFTKDEAFFVLFLDAATGKRIYSLLPGTEYRLPENAGEVHLDGVSSEALREAGIQLERPEASDRATFAPTRGQLFQAAAVDLGDTLEFVLARSVGEPYGDSALTWVASVNVGAQPQIDSSGQVIIGPYRYTLVFLDPDTGNAIFQRDVLIPDQTSSSTALAACSDAASKDKPNIYSVFRAYQSTAGLVADWRNEPREPDVPVGTPQFRSLPADTPVVVCIFDGDFPKSPPNSGNGTPPPNFNRELAVITEGNWFSLVLGYQANLPADYGPEAAP